MNSVSESHALTGDQATTPHFIEYARSHGFGDLHVKIDSHTGMIAIIAIHSTRRGPALGGCRFIEYPDFESAIHDAMRLARGMSYKAASVNLPLGGGKSVIIKPREPFDRIAYMQAFGIFVEELNGRYITALDSGTQLDDMDIIAEKTTHVASLSRYDGDPSPFTAKGIFRGIEAAVAFQLGKSSVKGLHIAVQGLGHVGSALVKLLHEAGARLTVTDVNPTLLEKISRDYEAATVSTEEIFQIPCDVFSPCALGAVINDETIERFQTNIIAGAANNQLAHHWHGARLHEKGILYAPDYVINAGGLIFAASRYFNTSEMAMHQQLDHIYEALMEIFARSRSENLPTSAIADHLAEERLA